MANMGALDSIDGRITRKLTLVTIFTIAVHGVACSGSKDYFKSFLDKKQMWLSFIISMSGVGMSYLLKACCPNLYYWMKDYYW